MYNGKQIERKENRIRNEDVGHGKSNNRHRSGEVTEDGVIVCGIWTGMEQVRFVKLCYPPCALNNVVLADKFNSSIVGNLQPVIDMFVSSQFIRF